MRRAPLIAALTLAASAAAQPSYDWDVVPDPDPPPVDRTVGVGAEVLGGVMLIDSARGYTGGEARPAYGARSTFELGRRLPPALATAFADVSVLRSTYREGTLRLYGESRYSYLVIAPAWGLPFGTDPFPMVFYGQVGGGVAHEAALLVVSGERTRFEGLQPLVQYGLGLRARPRVARQVVATFRVEVMRLRRAYMEDTFIGASAGLVF